MLHFLEIRVVFVIYTNKSSCSLSYYKSFHIPCILILLTQFLYFSSSSVSLATELMIRQNVSNNTKDSCKRSSTLASNCFPLWIQTNEIQPYTVIH